MGIFGFGRSDNLYFPGCYSSAVLSGKIENYRRILKKLNIDFKLHKEKDFLCCGGFFDESGYEKQLRKLAKENQDFLSSKGYKKIIISCPLCFNTFRSYKELLPNWNIEIEFITNTILSRLRESNFPKSFFSEPIAYYDSCYNARYLENIQAPREILKILGYPIFELPKNKEETLCGGSCGQLPATNTELSNKIAENFIKILKRKKIKKIVTADPRAYGHLKANFERLNVSEDEIRIFELSDLICESLNIH